MFPQYVSSVCGTYSDMTAEDMCSSLLRTRDMVHTGKHGSMASKHNGYDDCYNLCVKGRNAYVGSFYSILCSGLGSVELG